MREELQPLLAEDEVEGLVGTGSASASPWRQSIAGACARAAPSIPSLRSMPATVPRSPTLRAASRATMPVPQATSRTRSPSRGAASATSCSASGRDQLATA
jgi:hypothetical protein